MYVNYIYITIQKFGVCMFLMFFFVYFFKSVKVLSHTKKISRYYILWNIITILNNSLLF